MVLRQEINAFRHRLLRLRGVAGEHRFNQRGFIDGIVQRQAHFDAIKRLLRDVEIDIALHILRRGNNIHIAVIVQYISLLIGNRIREGCFADRQLGHACVVINHLAPGDAV